MFRQIGPMEIILILAVLVLLFGAKKLPDLARGSGRALRIFKSETKGLMDEDKDEDDDKSEASRPRQVTQGEATVLPSSDAVQSQRKDEYRSEPS
ncbi:sec-independent protein translocase protein TatA [Mumia flava]|uniref:Sec-independent protein translocase protein TatA n=1 Tax=Mumia flava TaxID=1348852 RepID=A0A0B2B4G9_9ACTN|nr:Sec-independent protein translocase subunit TatA [Mumia flava]PJJ53488.1 sec-independent protein translocase protein TatA [Mumia flava]